MYLYTTDYEYFPPKKMSPVKMLEWFMGLMPSSDFFLFIGNNTHAILLYCLYAVKSCHLNCTPSDSCRNVMITCSSIMWLPSFLLFRIRIVDW